MNLTLADVEHLISGIENAILELEELDYEFDIGLSSIEQLESSLEILQAIRDEIKNKQ